MTRAFNVKRLENATELLSAQLKIADDIVKNRYAEVSDADAPAVAAAIAQVLAVNYNSLMIGFAAPK